MDICTDRLYVVTFQSLIQHQTLCGQPRSSLSLLSSPPPKYQQHVEIQKCHQILMAAAVCSQYEKLLSAVRLSVVSACHCMQKHPVFIYVWVCGWECGGRERGEGQEGWETGEGREGKGNRRVGEGHREG